ncbi:hypothetical protein T440DRAFT_467665 [Plenodomus tracheiphilus IPT5]|uniref:Uncharacterized protein n=1 Tax=Plenodomus tracheiphilus IPT5 TaxID=1408161 RepID=A0A6A7B7B8_9PLEO|nr:hypothetical protein T440DRAFT_467665 [Plenodomus tracheiphilus IPT5]
MGEVWSRGALSQSRKEQTESVVSGWLGHKGSTRHEPNNRPSYSGLNGTRGKKALFSSFSDRANVCVVQGNRGQQRASVMSLLVSQRLRSADAVAEGGSELKAVGVLPRLLIHALPDRNTSDRPAPVTSSSSNHRPIARTC